MHMIHLSRLAKTDLDQWLQLTLTHKVQPNFIFTVIAKMTLLLMTYAISSYLAIR